MPLRLPILILQHLPMGGDQSSHSVKRKSYANPSLAEARTLGRGPRRDSLAHSRFLATRVADGSSADQLAQDRAETAVVAALVPFCVAKAQEGTEQVALAKFRAEQSSYLAERPREPGRLGDVRGRKDSRQRPGACLLSEAL